MKLHLLLELFPMVRVPFEEIRIQLLLDYSTSHDPSSGISKFTFVLIILVILFVLFSNY